MITIQKSAGVFGDSYEFLHLRMMYSRCCFILLLLHTPYTQYPTISYSTIYSYIQPKYVCHVWGESQKTPPIQFSLPCRSTLIVEDWFSRCASEATGKKEEHR